MYVEYHNAVAEFISQNQDSDFEVPENISDIDANKTVSIAEMDYQLSRLNFTDIEEMLNFTELWHTWMDEA